MSLSKLLFAGLIAVAGFFVGGEYTQDITGAAFGAGGGFIVGLLVAKFWRLVFGLTVMAFAIYGAYVMIERHPELVPKNVPQWPPQWLEELLPAKRNSASDESSVSQPTVASSAQWNGEHIVGTVRNLTDERIAFVSIEYVLVDEHKQDIQTVYATNSEGIEALGAWEFEIPASALGAKGMEERETIVR